MPVGATIGAAVIGGGAAVVSSRQNARAIDRGTAAQERANDEAVQFQREAFNTQTALAEPFRQFGIQQANGLGEMFGFNPVGMEAAQGAGPMGGMGGMGAGGMPQNNALNDYFANNPDIAQEFSRVSGGGFGPNLPASYDQDRNDQVGREEFARFRADRFDMNEPGRNNPFIASVTGPSNMMGSGQVGTTSFQPGAAMGSPGGNNGQPVAMGGAADPNAINTAAQDRGRDRFQGSLFNDALQGQLGRAATGVDANFAASGDVYSGARMQAQQNTAADLGMNALGMYTNAMLGQPSTAGAQMASNAAGAFGSNSANLALGQGQNAANSAFARGQNNSNLTNNLSSLAQFGLGAFSGGGKPNSGFQNTLMKGGTAGLNARPGFGINTPIPSFPG